MSGVFLMDNQAATSFFPFVYNLATGAPAALDSFKSEVIPPYYMAADGGIYSAEQKAESKPQKQKYIQIIPMQNAIIKYDEECGAVGTETISNYLRRAYADDSIAGIVIAADSPGGDPMAVQKLSKTLSERNKPVLCHVHGSCNSAMYWIASHCDEIHSDFSLSMIGSIGVYITVMDVIGHYEQKGIKVEQVYADQSEEKNGGYRLWQGGDATKLKEEATKVCTQFIDVVSANRGIAKDSHVFKGGSFFTEEALSFNLIDGNLSFESTIERCYELSEGYAPKNVKNDKQMFGLGNKSAVKSLIETKVEDRNQEMVNAANAELQEKGLDAVLIDASVGFSTSAEAKTLVDKAASVEGLETKLTDLEGKITAKDAEIKKLQTSEGGAIGQLAGVKALFGEDADKEGFDLSTAIASIMEDNKKMGATLNPGGGTTKGDGADDFGGGEIKETLTEWEEGVQSELKNI